MNTLFIISEILGYIICGIISLYIFRRIHRDWWDDSDLAPPIFIGLGLLWPVGITIWIICKICILIFSETNSLYSKLDEILDNRKAKLGARQDTIIGYSTDEVTIKYPTLIHAKETGAKTVYRHFEDETRERVNL